jgi:hypothetical protein
MTGRTFHAQDCRFTPRAPSRVLRETHSHAARRTRHAAGFSFTELLFAVMILGIGFILVAAIFPVGLAQTKSNFDETHAAALARSGAAEVGRVAYANDFVSNLIAPLQVLNDDTASTTGIAQRNMISPSDPRYAWVGMYRRVPGSNNTAQLCMILVNRSQPFTGADFVRNDGVRLLEPRGVLLDVDANSIVTVRSVSASDGRQYNANASAPGTFVLLRNDNIVSGSGYTMTAERFLNGAWEATAISADDRAQVEGQNRLGGQVYRLGVALDANRFEWFPGAELNVQLHYTDPSDERRRLTITGLDSASAYIVGRNRTGPGNDFDGTTMDVAYYTTFISLK